MRKNLFTTPFFSPPTRLAHFSVFRFHAPGTDTGDVLIYAPELLTSLFPQGPIPIPRLLEKFEVAFLYVTNP